MNVLIVESNDDFVGVPKDSCYKCAERRLNTTIITSFNVPDNTAKSLKHYGMKCGKIICDC